MILLSLIIGIWIICGVLHYGIYLAYLHATLGPIRKELHQMIVGVVFLLSLLGPLALITSIMREEYKYGVKYVVRFTENSR